MKLGESDSNILAASLGSAPPSDASPAWVPYEPWLQAFCCGRRKGAALKNPAAALRAGGSECTLLVGRRVKLEVPDKTGFDA
jgi:hypothetical protein